ncbi:MAG: ABC transporter substrate-binding protein [Firmicutes bacterium]|nr:ABC transporter substrate-binding protein [Bacillota bacterium]
MKLLYKLLGVGLAFAMLTGCGKNATTPENSQTEQAQSAASNEKKDFEIACSNTMVSNALIALSKYAGYYDEEGLNVNLTPLNTAAEQFPPLLTGKINVAGGGAPAPIEFIEDGNDLVIIGGSMTAGSAIFCLPERKDEFKELNQETLGGKKVGVYRLDTGDIAFRGYLKDHGVDLSTIEFIELANSNTIMEALRKGTVDLGIIALTFRVTAEEQGFAVVKHVDELRPDFICCRVLTTKNQLESDRESYVHLLRAHIKAYKLLKTDPDKTVELLQNFIKIDEDVLRGQLYEYGHLGINPQPAKDKFIDFYDTMVDIKYAKGNVNIADYIDTSLFEEAITQILEENPDDEIYKELYEEFKATNTK